MLPAWCSFSRTASNDLSQADDIGVCELNYLLELLGVEIQIYYCLQQRGTFTDLVWKRILLKSKHHYGFSVCLLLSRLLLAHRGFNSCFLILIALSSIGFHNNNEDRVDIQSGKFL